MKKFLFFLLVLFVLSVLCSCGYQKSYAKYSDAQVEMAKAMGPMMKQEFDSQGKLVKQEMGNQVLIAAMLMMGKPESEIVQVISKITGMAPWAAATLISQISSGTGGHNTTVQNSGSGSISRGDNNAWQNPVTTTTTTSDNHQVTDGN